MRNKLFNLKGKIISKNNNEVEFTYRPYSNDMSKLSTEIKIKKGDYVLDKNGTKWEVETVSSAFTTSGWYYTLRKVDE